MKNDLQVFFVKSEIENCSNIDHAKTALDKVQMEPYRSSCEQFSQFFPEVSKPVMVHSQSPCLIEKPEKLEKKK